MLHSYHFDKTELKIRVFINFYAYYRKEKEKSSDGFGGRHLKIRDLSMDLDFKVHNSLGQMTNRNVAFYMLVSIYKFDKICNPVPCSTSKWPINSFIANTILGDPGRVSRGRAKLRDKSFQERAKKPLGSESYWTISKRLRECRILIGQKKSFVLLCPIGEQQLSSLFVCSYRPVVVLQYLSRYGVQGKF